MSSDVQQLPDGVSNEKAPQEGNGNGRHETERRAGKEEQDMQQQHQQQQQADDKPKQDGPAGGYDATPIPARPPGYTLKITIHRATNLPMADINSFSSDPYVLAQLDSDTPTRHKEDPPLRFRTPTIRQNTEPTWDEEWIVANVPASGFKLKLRVYDEDPADKDDRLGNVHIHVDSVGDGWPGLKEQAYEMKARMASKRAYLIRMAAVCLRTSKHIRGNLVVSIENLGRTQPDGQNGRVYTVGPCRWIRHYDPILGRMMGMKEPDEDGDEPKQAGEQANPNQQQQQQAEAKGQKDQKKVQKYNFQANQIQLQGPVPAKLYHRYVEFKPFVKGMFTGHGIRGFILSKGLHHQHARVYSFDRQTVWGHFPQGRCEEMTKQFLDLVHYDRGGRIFTYVLTLDALWRFTETGKEFGIDMLSKHTMHSDVSIYIAFSGEFFVRRLKHGHRPNPPDPIDSSSNIHPPEHGHNDWHPPNDIDGRPPDEDPPKDPSRYQLVIDNDSGTYRPNAALLPVLKDFLARALPGLHIQVLDCQADADKMSKMKDEQRERKKQEGGGLVYTQGSRDSSVSSSDEEDLDRVQAGYERGGGRDEHVHGDGQGLVGQTARDQKLRGRARWEKAKGQYRGRAPGVVGGEDGEEGAEAAGAGAGKDSAGAGAGAGASASS